MLHFDETNSQSEKSKENTSETLSKCANESNDTLRDPTADDCEKPLKTVKRFIFPAYDNHDSELLPENWIKVRHVSGVIVYVHQPTRVVTLSHPYCIGTGNLRYHRIPLLAIPCLAYRTNREKSEGASFVGSAVVVSETLQDLEIPLEHTWAGDLNNKPTLKAEDPVISDDENYDEDDEKLFNNDGNDKEEGELSSDDDIDDDNYEPPTKRTLTDKISTTIRDKTIAEPLSYHHSMKSKTQGLSITARQSEVALVVANKNTAPNSPVSQCNPENQIHNQIPKQDAPKSQTGDRDKEGLLPPNLIRDYCARLFDLKEEESLVFRNRGDRFRYLKSKKKSSNLQLSEESNLIRYQIPPVDGCPSRRQAKERVINPTGKSPVCILHEYCQNVMRKPPVYRTAVQEGDKAPYRVVVVINDEVFAVGTGSSKKEARSEGARMALEKLIPDFKKIMNSSTGASGKDVSHTSSAHDLSVFDTVSITDRRLYELTVRTASLSPYAILTECLNRSCIPENDLRSCMTSLGRNQHYFELGVGDNNVKVHCKNKREGRHLAAQELLALLHPQVKTWAEMLELYGPGSKPDKRCDSEAILDAQARGPNSVRSSLIRLLKSKMLELADQWVIKEKSKQKGKFNVSPFNLPAVTFHPDAGTALYSAGNVDTGDNFEQSSIPPASTTADRNQSSSF